MDNVVFAPRGSSQRAVKCQTIYCNHRLPRMTLLHGQVLGDGPKYLLMPTLLSELAKCRNIERIFVWPGAIMLCQDYTEPWEPTLAEVAKVFEIPFVKRWLDG